MKNLSVVSVFLILAGILLSCNAQTDKVFKAQGISAEKNIEVIYFHFSRRCATCQAIEKVSSEAVDTNYGDRVVFLSYNLDKPDGKKRGEELGITGQSLLILGGDKPFDLTRDAFMNARSNPDQLKKLIKEKVDSLL